MEPYQKTFKVSNDIGKLGEEIAARLYTKKGYQIIARNFYNPRGKRFGEIDLVVMKENRIIFVEVKARTGVARGSAVESLTPPKAFKLIKTIQYFLARHAQFADGDFLPRIDLCALQLNKLDKSVKSVIIITNAVTLNY